MKNRIGKPEFIVRLNESEETIVIELAKDFKKDSYAKTLISVAMDYKREINLLRRSKEELIKMMNEDKKEFEALQKENKSLRSKMDKFVSLVDKVADIKKELQIFRQPGRRLTK